jgi:Tol biopolymer transport system component
MTSERLRQIEQLYHRALEQETDSRAAFVAEACGDDEELRQEVESLLAESRDDAFLETPIVQAAAKARAHNEAQWNLAGKMLTHYRVINQIGAGGMGVVYLAHDETLGREVTIKVLNPVSLADKMAQHRLRKEGVALAKLSHTNIESVYEFASQDGIDFLVAEYVRGETLHGPMKFEEALPIIRQLIDGIEAAHDQNIVHRDLKPANIKITPDGVVKILDFGLAKASTPEADDTLERSPTDTTATGTILGTAAYMSPEQARGKAADKRSDVWGFGVVVYELLSGKKAFEGDSVVETLAIVLNKEPDLSGVPERARPLLEWCLEKDCKRRLQAIGDARRVLDQPAEQQGIARSRPWLPWIAAIAVIFALAVGWFASMEWPRRRAPRGIVRFTIDPPPGKSFGAAEVSPDGKRVALLAHAGQANAQLMIRNLDDLALRPVPGMERINPDFLWSPDSHKIAFVQDGEVKTVDLSAGTVETLCSANHPDLSDWGNNGTILFDADVPDGRHQVFGVSTAGGAPKPMVALDASRKETVQDNAQFLPGNKRILYRSGAGKAPGMYAVSLDSAERKFVMSDVGYYLRDPESGRSYMFSCRTSPICQVKRFDLDILQVTGEPYVIPELVPPNLLPGAVSSVGLVSVLRGRTSVKLAWYSRDGKELETVAGPDTFFSHELSFDDRKVALEVLTEPVGMGDVWIEDLSRGSKQRLTSDPGWEYTQRFWPDGSKIAFLWSHGDPMRFHIAIKPANGTGTEEMMLESQVKIYLDDVSPDGAFILYDRVDAPRSLWVLPMANRRPILFRSGPGASWEGRFSPDGRRVAFTSTDSGSPEIQVLDFISEAGAPQRTKDELGVVSTGGGSKPRWSRDGKEIFYISPDHTLMTVPVKTAGGFAVGKPEKLFRLPGAGQNYSRIPYSVSSDGRRFLVAVPEGGQAEGRVVVVANWMESLPR